VKLCILTELFHQGLLSTHCCLQLVALNFETRLAHLKVLNNQAQVFVDSVEVLDFLPHLCHLLVQDFDLPRFRLNFSFKLFDLVVEHEFKLLQLLSLAFQRANPVFLVFDCFPSFCQVCLLVVDLSLYSLALIYLIVEPLVHNL